MECLKTKLNLGIQVSVKEEIRLAHIQVLLLDIFISVFLILSIASWNNHLSRNHQIEILFNKISLFQEDLIHY